MKLWKLMIEKEDIVFLILIAMFTWLFAWKWYPYDWVPYYWMWSPNRYRIWAQLMIQMNGFLGFSIRTWDCAGFILFLSISYFAIRPHDLDYVAMLAFPVLLLGVVYHSPIYALLALMMRYRDSGYAPLLLYPLVLVKEISLWIGMIALLLFSKQPRYKVLSCAFVAGLLYVLIHFVIIGEVGVEPSKPLLTWFTWFQIPYEVAFGLEGILESSAVVIFSIFAIVRTKRELKNILLMVLPIFFAALPWEPQLWVPVLLVIIAERSTRKPFSEMFVDNSFGVI